MQTFAVALLPLWLLALLISDILPVSCGCIWHKESILCLAILAFMGMDLFCKGEDIRRSFAYQFEGFDREAVPCCVVSKADRQVINTHNQDTFKQETLPPVETLL